MNQARIVFIFVSMALFFLTGCPSSVTVKNSKKASSKPAASVSFQLQKGKPAPPFSLNDLSNSMRTLKEFKGKVVLLNFWATWCTPCKKELPYFQQFYTKYKKDGFVVIGISTDSGASVAQVGPTVRRSGYSFPILLDTEGKVSGLYNPKQRMPFSALIDRKGQLRLEHPGFTPGDEKVMEKLIKILLKER